MPKTQEAEPTDSFNVGGAGSAPMGGINANMGNDDAELNDMPSDQASLGGMNDGFPEPNDNSEGEDGSEFNTNFDAGVDADEEEDPKKFIQQLTGKLSQSLRKYNEDNGDVDNELNKYVVGMVAKQAADGLSKEDAKEIIKKIKSNDGGDDVEESVNRDAFDDSKIEEITNSVLSNIRDKESSLPTRKVNGDFKMKPYTCPSFKN